MGTDQARSGRWRTRSADRDSEAVRVGVFPERPADLAGRRRLDRQLAAPARVAGVDTDRALVVDVGHVLRERRGEPRRPALHVEGESPGVIALAEGVSIQVARSRGRPSRCRGPASCRCSRSRSAWPFEQGGEGDGLGHVDGLAVGAGDAAGQALEWSWTEGRAGAGERLRRGPAPRGGGAGPAAASWHRRRDIGARGERDPGMVTRPA